MNTDTRYDDATLSTAIDEAFIESEPQRFITIEVHSEWEIQAPARLSLARALLARLPEPTPPTADGKTPGQVAYAGFHSPYTMSWETSPYRHQYEAAASAVLTTFGGQQLAEAQAKLDYVHNMGLRFGMMTSSDKPEPYLAHTWTDDSDHEHMFREWSASIGGQASLEAGIKRMEALTMDEIFHAYDHQKGVTSEKLNTVRSRLIAAAREAQPSSQPTGQHGPAGMPPLRGPGLILEPPSQPAEIPWIEWNGGECPLKDEDVLEWECSWPDGERTKYGCKPSDTTGWDHITRYRVTKWREGQPAAVDLSEALAIANKSADEQMRFKREAEARAEKAEARIKDLEEKNKRQADELK